MHMPKAAGKKAKRAYAELCSIDGMIRLHIAAADMIPPAKPESDRPGEKSVFCFMGNADNAPAAVPIKGSSNPDNMIFIIK